MTSNPASRSARAMILAPRSWPSRPTLPTSSRSRGPSMVSSEDADFAVLAEHGLHRTADLPDRRAPADRLEDQGHQVLTALRAARDGVERAGNRAVVAGRLDLREARLLLDLDLPADLQDVESLSVLGDVLVHAHDGLLAAVDLLLI